MNFDLDNFDSRKGAEEGFELQLTDPKTGTPTPEYITVLGVDSDAYQSAVYEQQRRQIKAMAKSRKVMLTPEEIKANEDELRIACTKAWRGDKLGKVAFTPAAATALYASYPEIKEQVDRAIADRANFLPSASTS